MTGIMQDCDDQRVLRQGAIAFFNAESGHCLLFHDNASVHSERDMQDFPQITTSRYVLRKLVATDMPLVFKGMSDPQVIEYYGLSYETLESTQAQMEWFELIYHTRTGIWWAIADLAAPEQLLGCCGISDWEQDDHCAEMGFWLFPQYWRQGVMKEVLSAALHCCFHQLGLHRIQALVEPDNQGSWRLLERLGFQLEGILRECERKGERYVDLRCYSRLATDPVSDKELTSEDVEQRRML